MHPEYLKYTKVVRKKFDCGRAAVAAAQCILYSGGWCGSFRHHKVLTNHTTLETCENVTRLATFDSPPSDYKYDSSSSLRSFPIPVIQISVLRIEER